jgi:hypothetical protein
MDLEKTLEKGLKKETVNNSLKKNEKSEDEIIKIWKSHPLLRKLAQAASEEFDENGNYIGK